MAKPAHIAERLADWTVGLDPKALRAPLREVARRCLADTLAVALAGSTTAPARAAAHGLAPQGEASLIGRAARTTADKAALANGVAAHALDFDDTCFAGIVHGSAVIWPALLAVGEARGSSGEELMAAFVAGSEAAYALGAALGPGLYDRGWWPTGWLTGIGAAAGVAKLSGLDRETTAQAIALAACQAGGLRVTGGSAAKAYLAGRAAEAAVQAAALAGRGLTGPGEVFEGPNGLFQMVGGGAVDLGQLDSLGAAERLLDPGLVVKAWPLCSCAQAPLEAFLGLLKDYEIDPEAVRSVVCEVTPMIAATLRFAWPETPAQALFSLPFICALATRLGTIGPYDLVDAHLRDPGLRAFAARVRLRRAPDLFDIRAFPEAARVSLELGDGRRLAANCEVASGDPRRPMAEAALKDKVLRCVAPLLGPQADRLYARARRFDRLDTLAPLMNLARKGACP